MPVYVLDQEIKSAIKKLGPEVVHVAYRLGTDSTGDRSIFFRVTLTDAAAREDTLADTTRRISTLLLGEIKPIEDWELNPYFNFRSQAEQEARPDSEWM
jgi:hypothetical protein